MQTYQLYGRKLILFENLEKMKGIAQQKFDELQKKIDLLKRDLAKFVHGEGTLDALLADQKSSLEKDGLGFKLINKNAFGRGNQRSKMKYNMSYERCTDCSRRGHPSSKSILCALKNHFTNHFVRASPNIVEMWIKKSERHLYKIVDTNTAGPKMRWGT